MARKKLPEFNNIEDMANFWDTHDSTEFEEGEIEAIEYKPKRLVLTVRFDAGDMLAITREARRLGDGSLNTCTHGKLNSSWKPAK
jgi:hypothetical protein